MSIENLQVLVAPGNIPVTGECDPGTVILSPTELAIPFNLNGSPTTMATLVTTPAIDYTTTDRFYLCDDTEINDLPINPANVAFVKSTGGSPNITVRYGASYNNTSPATITEMPNYTIRAEAVYTHLDRLSRMPVAANIQRNMMYLTHGDIEYGDTPAGLSLGIPGGKVYPGGNTFVYNEADIELKAYLSKGPYSVDYAIPFDFNGGDAICVSCDLTFDSGDPAHTAVHLFMGFMNNQPVPNDTESGNELKHYFWLSGQADGKVASVNGNPDHVDRSPPTTFSTSNHYDFVYIRRAARTDVYVYINGILETYDFNDNQSIHLDSGWIRLKAPYYGHYNYVHVENLTVSKDSLSYDTNKLIYPSTSTVVDLTKPEHVGVNNAVIDTTTSTITLSTDLPNTTEGVLVNTTLDNIDTTFSLGFTRSHLGAWGAESGSEIIITSNHFIENTYDGGDYNNLNYTGYQAFVVKLPKVLADGIVIDRKGSVNDTLSLTTHGVMTSGVLDGSTRLDIEFVQLSLDANSAVFKINIHEDGVLLYSTINLTGPDFWHKHFTAVWRHWNDGVVSTETFGSISIKNNAITFGNTVDTLPYVSGLSPTIDWASAIKITPQGSVVIPESDTLLLTTESQDNNDFGLTDFLDFDLQGDTQFSIGFRRKSAGEWNTGQDMAGFGIGLTNVVSDSVSFANMYTGGTFGTPLPADNNIYIKFPKTPTGQLEILTSNLGGSVGGILTKHDDFTAFNGEYFIEIRFIRSGSNMKVNIYENSILKYSQSATSAAVTWHDTGAIYFHHHNNARASSETIYDISFVKGDTFESHYDSPNVKLGASDALATLVRKLIDKASLTDRINNVGVGLSAVDAVADITERDNLVPTQNMIVMVLDGTDDPTVDVGSSMYFYNFSTSVWTKIYEEETMDSGFGTWANIVNGVSSTGPEVDAFVNTMHSHIAANILALNGISETAEGWMLYNNIELAPGIRLLDLQW
jgi:hypothetical protein